MAPNIRENMKNSIEALVESSSADVVQGKFYIIYERLSDFKWLPGNGDGESGRAFKHWKLLIRIGFDSFTVEFLENSLISRQGLVIVSPFDSSTNPATTYYLADISIDTETLYKRILAFFNAWTVYSIKCGNCQHFVQHFLLHYQSEGHLTNQTAHFYKVYNGLFRGTTKTSRVASFFCRMGSRSKSNS
ncbi:hypothetical protein BGW39_002345 [Mortierella sp. 14UC]|nr:hypothetical protein BGW39_002345 [Mortierella sp. 14UC]